MKYLIFTLICSTICFSQTKGNITYRKEILQYLTESPRGLEIKKNNPETFNDYQKIDKNVKLLLKDLTFGLTFNNNESLFKVDDFLELENNNYYGFAVGPYGSGVYYTNSKTKESLVKLEAYGQRFIIKKPQIKWTLTNSSKIIGSYLCYKATTIKKVMGRNGIIKTDIIAWYVPKLSIPFGPLGYSGLPGLIIDLTIGKTRFYLDKINLNPKKKIIIKKPVKGKQVSKGEFEAIGLEAMGKMQHMLKKN